MKKFLCSKFLLKITACIAFSQAIQTANAACCLVLFEPEMPDELKDLVK